MRFLVVDDDESIHLFLEEVLDEYGECDCVTSGDAGVDQFSRAHAGGAPYDVVLMDILMPGMDGHQAAELMRAHERKLGISSRESFKLVMITSLVDDINVSKAYFSTHACCYIVKPLEKTRVIDEFKQNLII